MPFVSLPLSLRPNMLAGWGAADVSDPAFAAAIDGIVKAIQKKDTGKAAGLIAAATLTYGTAIVEVGKELFQIKSDSLEALEKKRAKYEYKVATSSGDTKAKYKYKLAAVKRQIAALTKTQEVALQALDQSSAEIKNYAPPVSTFPSWLPLAFGGGLLLLGGVALIARKDKE